MIMTHASHHDPSSWIAHVFKIMHIYKKKIENPLIHSFWSALIQTENISLLRKSVGGTKAIRNISHAVDWKCRNIII